MIVEATYKVNESGIYMGKAYHDIKYTMTMPLTFGSSRLNMNPKC